MLQAESVPLRYSYTTNEFEEKNGGSDTYCDRIV